SATGIASFIQTGGILNLRGFYLNKTSAVSSWNDLRTVPIDFTNHSNSPSRALQVGKGTLNIEDPENLFSMTGGIINIYDVCDQSSGDLVVDIKSESQNIKVTGGTINIFSSSGLAEKIATTAPLGNISITRTAGNAPVILGKNLNVLGNLSINSSALFDAASFDVAVGGDFTIQNNAVYTPGSNNTIFNGNRGQSFIVGGTINGGLNNLNITKGSNTILSNNITVNGNLSIDSACILNDGGNQINIGSDGIATNNLVNNSGRHVSSLNGSTIFNGTGNQIIGGSGNGIWANLNLNKTGGSVIFSSDQTINGDLRLANSQGILNIGSFRLSLSGNSHVYDALTGTMSNFNAGRMILTSGNRSDGGLNKTFNSTNSFVFPVGTTAYYTPVSIEFKTAPAAYGSVSVSPVTGKHPLVQGTNALAYYWKTAGTGFTGISPHSVVMKYYYNEAFVQGTEADYVPAVFNSPSWSYMNDPFKVNDAENEILCDTSSFITGEYTAGPPDVFGTVQTYYSRDAAENIKTTGASWEDAGSWSTDPVLKWAGAAASSAPCAACRVVIGDGFTYNHKININSNGAISPYLQIRYGSTLDLGMTTGHTLSIIADEKYSEMGTLRISSATEGGIAEFPQGDWGSFTGKQGGTVEYYSDAADNHSFTIPLISAGMAPAGAKSLDHYDHLKLSPADGKIITMPDQNISVLGNMTVAGNNTGTAVLNSISSRTLSVAGNLLIQGGALRYNNGTAQTVKVNGNVNIGSGTFEVSNSGGTPTNLLFIGGGLNNKGIFNMNNTGICEVTFTGSSNAQLTGTGSNNFHLLTIDKGNSSTSVLDVLLTGSGNLTLPNTAQALFLTNGTFRVTSAPPITLTTTADFLIPETGCLSVNGGSVIVASGLSNNGIKL
ncbi:MAG: hypothetical protein Q8910_14515, partial [Bacteroidota bacterium]|nr:hypothetical protein [Bacteroidota bacterium]